MKLKLQKNMRILADMMGYCYHLGGSHFSMDMDLRPECTRISLCTEVDGLPDGEVARMRDTLNIPRQRDMEQNYWNVSGGEETGDELLLVGVMVDEAQVRYEEGRLCVELVRRHYSREE